MTCSLFLNRLLELYQNFSLSLDCNCNRIYVCVLWLLLLLLFCFIVVIPSIQNFWEDEHTQKGRAKSRKKSWILNDWSFYQKKEDEKKTLISFFKSSLCQHPDTIRFRELLCPDRSCEVCNSATAEMDRLLFSLALEDTTPSVLPLASTAPVTEPSFTQPSAFSAVPPGDLLPPPLPEPFPPPPSKLSPNTGAPLGHFLSLSLPAHSLPTDPFPPLELEFPVHHSPPQPLAFPSLPPHNTQSVKMPLILNTISLDTSITQDINLSPDLAQTLTPTESVTPQVPSNFSVLPSPNYSLTVTQHKLNYISFKPVLENSSLDNTGPLSTYVPQGIDYPRQSVLESSFQKVHAEDSLPSTLETSDKDMAYESEKDLDSYMMSVSVEKSVVSGKNVSQRKLENALKVHLSKKFEEVNKGWLSGTVNRSWHAIQQTVSVKPHTELKQRRLPPSVGWDDGLNTSQELSFVESSVQQMLEAHVTKFQMRMLWGLSPKVLESIESSSLKVTSSHSLFNSIVSSSNKLLLEVDSKSGGFLTLRGSSKCPHRDKIKTANSASFPKHPLPATLLVGNEGQGTLRQSPSDIIHGLAEEVQRIPDSRKTLLPVTSISDKASLRHSPILSICPPKMHTRQARARHKPKSQSVNISHQIKMGQGKMKKKSEPVFMPKVSRAEELDALQSKTHNVLTLIKSNANENEGETTLTTESLQAKQSVLQDPKSSDLKKQVSPESKYELQNGEYSLTQDQSTYMSHSLDSLASKASLTHVQGVSTADMGASQVLHVHSEDREINMEQQQELWVPKHDLRLGLDNNLPSAAKKVSLTGSKSEDLGGGDAGLGTAQPGRKRFPTRDVELEETIGSKPPQTISQKRESLPGSLFKNKMNRFFQWLHPGTKCKKQDYSQEKGSPITSGESRGLVKSKAAFTGKLLEEKLGHRHAKGITCTQELLPSAEKFGNAQKKVAVGTWSESVLGHPFNSRSPSYKITDTKSCCQVAVCRNRDRYPQKTVALKDKLCQKQPQSLPCRGTVPHESPVCRWRATQGPPAAFTTAGGRVKLSLYYLDRNQFCRIFRRNIIPTQK